MSLKSSTLVRGISYAIILWVVGFVLVLVTLVLDTLVYVLLLGSGDYFTFLSIWVAYVMFVLVPWLVGRHLQQAP